MLSLTEDWEFNVLGIYNYRRSGPFDALFDFIRNNHHRLPGDIVEAGVFRGSSLIAIAMLLKELGSNKRVHGFDSFAGFPPVYDSKDDVSEFERMFDSGLVDLAHIDAVRRNLKWRQALKSASIDVGNISTSGDFSGTSLEFVKRKIDLVGLDNIVLVDGPFSLTMRAATHPTSIFAVLMDCDLYASYWETFQFCWPRLVPGGMIYLDEYFSLKFPGARRATDTFLSDKKGRLLMAPRRPGDFERWYVLKD
jgi:hypothetical protein